MGEQRQHGDSEDGRRGSGIGATTGLGWVATRWQVAAWLLLALLAGLGLGRSLWTPDEPREAEISREMYLRPQVIPTLGGRPFYEKPPLYYLLVAGAFALAGEPSIEAARAVSGAAGLLTLVALYAWGARAAGRRAALIAVFLLGTSAQFLVSTHWVLIDPLLMLFGTVAAWAGWELVSAERGQRWRWLFYLALALALWTKGLIGPLMLAAGLGAFCLLERPRRPWVRLRPVAAAAFLAAVALSVAAAIYLQGGREALWAWGWVNHVQRLVDPLTTGHRQPIYYYLQTLPVTVLPWLVPLLDLCRPAYWSPAAPAAGLRRYCGALLVGGITLLSLAATKREIYLLPLLAPLFLLLALAVADRFAASDFRAGWQRAGEWIHAVLLALLCVAPAAAVLAYTRSLSAPTLAALAAGLVIGAGLLRATARRRLDRQATFSASAAVLLPVSVLLLAVPILELQKDFTPFLATLNLALPVGAPVYARGADETLLGIVPFVTGRRLVELPAGAPRGGGAAPPLVLVQAKGRLPSPDPGLGPGYERIASRSLGHKRHLTLWRLKAVPAKSAPRLVDLEMRGVGGDDRIRTGG